MPGSDGSWQPGWLSLNQLSGDFLTSADDEEHWLGLIVETSMMMTNHSPSFSWIFDREFNRHTVPSLTHLCLCCLYNLFSPTATPLNCIPKHRTSSALNCKHFDIEMQFGIVPSCRQIIPICQKWNLLLDHPAMTKWSYRLIELPRS